MRKRGRAGVGIFVVLVLLATFSGAIATPDLSRDSWFSDLQKNTSDTHTSFDLERDTQDTDLRDTDLEKNTQGTQDKLAESGKIGFTGDKIPAEDVEQIGSGGIGGRSVTLATLELKVWEGRRGFLHKRAKAIGDDDEIYVLPNVPHTIKIKAKVVVTDERSDHGEYTVKYTGGSHKMKSGDKNWQRTVTAYKTEVTVGKGERKELTYTFRISGLGAHAKCKATLTVIGRGGGESNEVSTSQPTQAPFSDSKPISNLIFQFLKINNI